MAVKKQNPIVAYFVPFGLKQLADLVLLAGSIILIVGLFLHAETTIITLIGLGVYIAGALIAMLRCAKVIFAPAPVRSVEFNAPRKRTPEFKAAVINCVIMGIILLTAVLGILFTVLWME